MKKDDLKIIVLFVTITCVMSYLLGDGINKKDFEQIMITLPLTALFGMCWYIIIFTKPIDRNESYYQSFKRQFRHPVE